MEARLLYIAALLTVHNRRETTLNCLKRLYANNGMEGVNVDVWLTDDGCTDGTAEAVSKQYPDVHIVKGDGSLYWNRGMIAAWQAAATARNYDYYLWLNDDTYLYPNALTSLMSGARATDGQAIIVGATTSTDHTQLTYGGRTSKGIAPLDGKLTAVNYFNGNIVLIPRSAYVKVGTLDPYFIHALGDFDYGLRAGKLGVEMRQVGEALGECDLHSHVSKWIDPKVPLRSRWKALFRPNGMPPHEMFHFERRHNGVILASFHYLTVCLRCLCPWLWETETIMIELFFLQ